MANKQDVLWVLLSVSDKPIRNIGNNEIAVYSWQEDAKYDCKNYAHTRVVSVTELQTINPDAYAELVKTIL